MGLCLSCCDPPRKIPDSVCYREDVLAPTLIYDDPGATADGYRVVR